MFLHQTITYSLFLILGIAYLVESLKLPIGTTSAPAAGFYPLSVGIFLVFLASSLLVLQKRKTEDKEIEAFPKGKERIRVIAVSIALILFVILLKPLGYILSSFGLLIIILRILGLRSWSKILLISIFASIISHYIFEKILAIPFPPGILGLL